MSAAKLSFKGRVAQRGGSFFLECPSRLWTAALALLDPDSSLLPRGHQMFRFPAAYGVRLVASSWELFGKETP